MLLFLFWNYNPNRSVEFSGGEAGMFPLPGPFYKSSTKRSHASVVHDLGRPAGKGRGRKNPGSDSGIPGALTP